VNEAGHLIITSMVLVDLVEITAVSAVWYVCHCSMPEVMRTGNHLHWSKQRSQVWEEHIQCTQTGACVDRRIQECAMHGDAALHLAKSDPQ
jgi:hypothetical protein